MRNNKNKGFSLVELLVAVTILSIIMLAIGWILASMSKSFALSQKEVELQNSVQSTYTVVSDLIKEAQYDSSTVDCIEFSADKAYIIVQDKTTKENSVVYIVYRDSKKRLYLYYTDLYESDGTVIDYKGIGAGTLTDDNNLLARNIESWSVDTSNIDNGYVVLSLKGKYGSRTASIVQNVYLRNSNEAVSVYSSDETSSDEDTTDYSSYYITSIGGYSDSAVYSAIGDPIDLSTITFTNVELSPRPSLDGTSSLTAISVDTMTGETMMNNGLIDALYNEDLSEVLTKTTAATTNGTLVCLDSRGRALGYQYTDLTFTVVAGSSSDISFAGDNQTEPEGSSANTNSDLNVYYDLDKSSVGSTNIEVATEAGYVCDICGTPVTNMFSYDGGVTYYFCCTHTYEESKINYYQTVYDCSNHGTDWSGVPLAGNATLGSDGKYYCNECGTEVASTFDYWGSGSAVTHFSCQHTSLQPVYSYETKNCANQYVSLAGHATEVPAGTSTVSYTTGKGYVYVSNESTDIDYTNVSVTIYLDDSNAYFNNISEGVYLKEYFRSSLANGKNVSYKISGPKSDGYTKYITITFDELPKMLANGTACTYGFEFEWAIPTSEYSADFNIPIATYNITYN